MTDTDIGSCAICNKTSTSKCARCKTTFYCSVAHQKEHWINGHREECKVPPAPAPCPPIASEGQQNNWSSLKSTTRKYEPEIKEEKRVEKEEKKEVNLVTTPSTINSKGEPATLLRQRMSAAYYDAAEEALNLVLTFNLSSEAFADAKHPNAKQAVEDFVRVRLEILTSARVTASLANAQNTLTVGEMLRNGTNAAHSLVRGRAHNVPATPAPRDPQMAEVYERIEAAIPEKVPMSYFCGFAEATLEAQMMLRDLSAERNHSDPLLVAATATCIATYIVAQDRVRKRLEKHAQGTVEHPEVVENLDRLKTLQREE